MTKRSVKNTHLLDGGGGGFNKGKVDAKHAKLHDHSQKHEPCEVMTQFSECEISNQKKAKREMIRKKIRQQTIQLCGSFRAMSLH